MKWSFLSKEGAMVWAAQYKSKIKRLVQERITFT